MIHQFAELGQYYHEREGIGTSSEDQLGLDSHDPTQKFRTNTVLLLVFSNEGFRRVHVEQYDDPKRLMYLDSLAFPRSSEFIFRAKLPA